MLGNLGSAYANLRDYGHAMEYHEKALVISRETGDRRSEGNALANISEVLYQTSDRKRAIEHAEAALKIFEEIEHPYAAKVRKQLEKWQNV